MNITNLEPQSLSLIANTIRTLSADGVEKAASGHPGMPMGVSEIGLVLWLKYLRFNPEDPKWIGRDRFVLSNGHGSMFIYSMLHLCGYNLSMEDLKNFRQWKSKTPGHPESFITPGVECTTGPLGQGIANAVGMAMGQKHLAANYQTETLNHLVYCMVGDGCLMEGISNEASSMAGHLGLGNLIVLYDDNKISIAGSTELAFTENVANRYEALGWHTLEVDGHDVEAIDQAIAEAISVIDKPSLICARTIIGKGAPKKQNTSGVHGSPLGTEELLSAKKNLNWPEDKSFYVPEEVSAVFAERKKELLAEYAKWQSEFTAWQGANAELSKALENQLESYCPVELEKELLEVASKIDKPAATRKISGDMIQVISARVSSLIGGSADLEPSTLTLIKDSTDITKDSFVGRNIRFGVREHAMGAVMNGLAYYGGYIPYGSTFLTFADYMKPAIRLAALSGLQCLYVFTHDSVFLGEDGPTHQPVEHLASLRIIPNLYVFRPADAVETAICYSLALSKKSSPSALALTRQNVSLIKREENFDTDQIKKGAYTVAEYGSSEPEHVIVATGSELSVALEVGEKISASVKGVRVVSMPCTQIFAEQDASFRNQLIPRSAKKTVIEAGVTYGWAGVVGACPDDLLIGVDTFGTSAPAEVIAEKFGLTSERVLEKFKQHWSL